MLGPREDQQLPFVKSSPPEIFHPSPPQIAPGAVPSRVPGEREPTPKSSVPTEGNSHVWNSVYYHGEWRISVQSERCHFALSMSHRSFWNPAAKFLILELTAIFEVHCRLVGSFFQATMETTGV